MNGVMCNIEGVVNEDDDVFSPLYKVADLKAEVVEVHGVSALNGISGAGVSALNGVSGAGVSNGIEDDGRIVVKVDPTSAVAGAFDSATENGTADDGGFVIKVDPESVGAGVVENTNADSNGAGAENLNDPDSGDAESDDDVESSHEEEPQIRYATRASTRAERGEPAEESDGDRGGWGSDFIDDDEGDYDSDVPGQYRAKPGDDSDYVPTDAEESEDDDEIPSEDDDPDFDEDFDDSFSRRGRTHRRGKTSRGRGRTRSRSPLDDDGVMFKWRKIENKRKMKEFTEKVGPQKEFPDDVNELDFFEEYFTNEVWELLVTMTNLAASRHMINHSKPWQDCTVADMKVFIGLVIAMGIIRLPHVEMYWQRRRWFFEIPSFGKVMSRERFQQMWRYLSFCDETKINEQEDRLSEIRPLLDLLLPKFEKAYIPEKNLSIDESMIPYRGKIFFVQYSSNKRIKYGIQVWVLAESKTGYVSRFDIFTEKNRNKRLSEVGLATRVVNHLIKPFEGKGYHLYVDNFYTSPHLFKSLYEREVYACGTCKRDRKGFPDAILINAKEHKRGFNRWVMDGPLLAQAWLDCRPYYYMSTIHRPKHEEDAPKELKFVKRQLGGKNVDVPCPPLVHDYNTGTVGVAFNNMQRKCYDLGRKSTRWSRRVFFYLLEVVAHNSLILRNHCLVRRATKWDNTPLQFRMDLVSHLIKGMRATRPSERVVPVDVPRLLNVGVHLPKVLQRPRTCKVCSKISWNEYERQYRDVPKEDRPKKSKRYVSQTSMCCEACNVALCVCRERNCFKEWHTKVDYWVQTRHDTQLENEVVSTQLFLSPLLVQQ